jgi:putative transposase
MKPAREHATNNRQTYFVTSTTWGRRGLFRDEKWAKLFLEVLYHYGETGYQLHEFVLMWDHFHLIITPKTSLERAAQFIKGGFSFRAKKELLSQLEVWQPGFSDHRIRDAEDYHLHKDYVYQNPVKKGLVSAPHEYPYSSAAGSFDLDPVPQWLKPHSNARACGTAEAVPFQNRRKTS